MLDVFMVKKGEILDSFIEKKTTYVIRKVIKNYV